MKPRYKPQICSICGKTSYRGLTKKRCTNCYRAYKQSLAPKIECQCIDPNCKILIPSIDVFGNPKKFVKGHSSKGSGNPMYNNGISNDREYIIEYNPNHPLTPKYKYMRKHRLIYEEYYNVCLLPYTHIHHINKNKKDNRIENLLAVYNSEHIKIHKTELRELISKRICFLCGKTGKKIRWFKHLNDKYICRSCKHKRDGKS